MCICTVSLEIIIMQFQPLKQYHGIRRGSTYTNRWEWYTIIHVSKPLNYQLYNIILLYVPNYGLTSAPCDSKNFTTSTWPPLTALYNAVSWYYNNNMISHNKSKLHIYTIYVSHKTIIMVSLVMAKQFM